LLLRQLRFPGEITLIAGEHGLPYHRPPLSKELLTGDTNPENVAFRPARFFAEQAIDLSTGDPVVAIHRDRAAIELSSGTSLGYDRLVIATGSRPRALPMPGADLEGHVGSGAGIRRLTRSNWLVNRPAGHCCVGYY